MEPLNYLTSHNDPPETDEDRADPGPSPELPAATPDPKPEAAAKVTELEASTAGAIVEPAPSEIPEDPDADQPYTRGVWNGLPKLTCKSCGVSFLSEAEFWDHVRVHVPAEQQAEAMRVLIFGADGLPISRP